MSKIGKLPVLIPTEVKVKIDKDILTISGPKGELQQKINKLLKVEQKDNQLEIKVIKKERRSSALQGLTRTIIVNMIKGVTEGYLKTLEIQGVGYRASLEGKNLKLDLGFSHPVLFQPPQNIEIQVENNNLIKILGIDKQQVGQVAAQIRAIKPPEPYKGKGIRYLNEKIKRKAGKTAKAEAA